MLLRCMLKFKRLACGSDDVTQYSIQCGTVLVPPYLDLCFLDQFVGSGPNISKFLALAPERFGPLKTKNLCNNGATRLPHKLCLWNRNRNFRPRLFPPSRNFWLLPSKTAWAPARQPCFFFRSRLPVVRFSIHGNICTYNINYCAKAIRICYASIYKTRFHNWVSPNILQSTTLRKNVASRKLRCNLKTDHIVFNVRICFTQKLHPNGRRRYLNGKYHVLLRKISFEDRRKPRKQSWPLPTLWGLTINCASQSLMVPDSEKMDRLQNGKIA